MSNLTSVTDDQSRHSMNAMYRWTRHVYDASRKYYLLGRDRLIARMNAGDDEHVIEIGCGTARNLIKMKTAYPKTSFYGLDASDEMLRTAYKSIHRRGINLLPLAQAYSQNFDPMALFGLDRAPDKLVYSYSLSIIPPWKESIDHALHVLDRGGQMHIVDFGPQDGLPKWFQKFLFWWLKLFHVYYKPDILAYLKELETQGKGTLTLEYLYGGYAYYAVFVKA